MTEIPQAMVEAAARALHEHDRIGFPADPAWDELEDEPAWDELEDEERESYRDAMRVVLAAALAVCKLWEQWGHPDDSDIWMTTENIRDAVPPKDITTPPQEATDG